MADHSANPAGGSGNRTGLIQVYTGNGKGKTTASLGLALRALGHGWRVKVIQFMKGDPAYGEIIAAKGLPGLRIIQSGRPDFVNRKNPDPEDIRLARQGLEEALRAFAEEDLDLLILDELNVALDFGLVSLTDVLSLLERKPARLELVLTGRNAHEKVVERADLVSDIQEIKHPYRRGVPARDGIEH
ncbi:cob(I)yrinic acid a,c-diamide adenosyltransferase [bacterium]|nr:cob(I)yrinic acid a,c-diamide adenosyltransferase [bacterium]